MDTVTAKNISFHGAVVPKAEVLTVEALSSFSHEFTFGKSYLLAGKEGQGGWALSWIIGGLLKQNSGEILRNKMLYDLKDRRKDVWCVRHSEIKRFGIFTMSLKQQIRHGLRSKQSRYIKSEQEIIECFDLSAGRYNRLLRQFSYEGWRASCAAGMANGKQQIADFFGAFGIGLGSQHLINFFAHFGDDIINRVPIKTRLRL